MRTSSIVEIGFVFVKAGRNIPRLLAPDDLVAIGGKDLALDIVPAVGVDGVGDVGVELDARATVAVLLAQEAVLIETQAAIVAVAGAQMVFVGAAWAMIGEFARWHCQEESVVAFD